jgi:Glyoxalase-like domain
MRFSPNVDLMCVFLVLDTAGHDWAMSDTEPIGWIREIVLNSPDPGALAIFWGRLLGGHPVVWYPGWVTLEPPPRGQRLSFQSSEGTGSQDSGVHFDVLVDDLAAAHERVIGLGADYIGERWSPKVDDEGARVPWRVYTDPAGHPFCLVLR